MFVWGKVLEIEEFERRVAIDLILGDGTPLCIENVCAILPLRHQTSQNLEPYYPGGVHGL